MTEIKETSKAKRERIAIQMMAALATKYKNYADIDDVAKEAIDLADALIRQFEK
jgi:hypothetical protein